MLVSEWQEVAPAHMKVFQQIDWRYGEKPQEFMTDQKRQVFEPRNYPNVSHIAYCIANKLQHLLFYLSGISMPGSVDSRAV